MDPSFLFFLFLLMLGLLSIIADYLSWGPGGPRRSVRKRRRFPTASPVRRGSIEDRRQQAQTSQP